MESKARKFHLFIFYHLISRRSRASPIYLIWERYEIDACERIQPVNRGASCENICLDCLYISFAFKRDSHSFPRGIILESKIKVTLLKNNYSSILRISIYRFENFKFQTIFSNIEHHVLHETSERVVKNNIFQGMIKIQTSTAKKNDQRDPRNATSNTDNFHRMKDEITWSDQVLSPPYLRIKSLPDKSPVHNDRVNRIMAGSRCSTREFIALFIFPILSLSSSEPW